RACRSRISNTWRAAGVSRLVRAKSRKGQKAKGPIRPLRSPPLRKGGQGGSGHAVIEDRKLQISNWKCAARPSICIFQFTIFHFQFVLRSMSPFQGSRVFHVTVTQGVALGWKT